LRGQLLPQFVDVSHQQQCLVLLASSTRHCVTGQLLLRLCNTACSLVYFTHDATAATFCSSSVTGQLLLLLHLRCCCCRPVPRLAVPLEHSLATDVGHWAINHPYGERLDASCLTAGASFTRPSCCYYQGLHPRCRVCM
jgi:hypothetical protein